MGNASRVVAIIEALDNNVQCHVVTWGAGHRFFAEYEKKTQAAFTLHQMKDYKLKQNVISYLQSFLSNVILLRSLIRTVQPSLILLDSDYHFPAYLGTRAPVVYLGQALDILERAHAIRYRPTNWRELVTFALRERVDAWYQKLFADVILVPCFGRVGPVSRKIRRIPLIVRREFLSSARRTADYSKIGILLSGSEIEKSAFACLGQRFSLPVLNPVPSQAGMLDRFDVVVVQGGLSSISECVALSKFMVVVPIQDHPEQFLNAVQVEQLGLGIRSSLYEMADWPHLMDRVLRNVDQSPKSSVACTGAEAAARIILHDLLQLEAVVKPWPKPELYLLACKDVAP